MADEKKINNKLLRLYGKCPYTGQQKYRVVRSENQMEWRGGDHNEFYGNIFIRRTTGIKNLKKYWYFPKCWVLERVEPNRDEHTHFISKFNYEPFLTLLDKDNKPLPLNWKVVEFAIQNMLRAERRFLNEEDHRQEDEKKIKAEEEKTRAILDAEEPTKPLPTFKTSSLLVDTFKLVREGNKAKESQIVSNIMSGVK